MTVCRLSFYHNNLLFSPLPPATVEPFLKQYTGRQKCYNLQQTEKGVEASHKDVLVK